MLMKIFTINKYNKRLTKVTNFKCSFINLQQNKEIASGGDN